MTTIQNTTVTYNGERFTFNTATTLSEEMARLRRQGVNVLEALEGVKVAYIKDGELGVDDCDYRTIGTLGMDSDGDLGYTTALGDGQRGNIDSSGRVRRRNSHYITYPTGSDFYVEASYFAAKPHLGKVQKITVEQAIAFVLNDEFTLKTFGTCIWIDADTVKRYAPDYYSVPGGDFAEGALIATPDARILRVVEVTDKFIIAQHPAGHGETIALPITEGVEYKRVDEEVASAIL